MLDKIKPAGGPDAAGDLPMLARIREAAEQAKIRLSTEDDGRNCPALSHAEFQFPLHAAARRIGGPDPRHHPAHAPALPALAGRREAGDRKTSTRSSSSAARRACRWCGALVAEIFGCAEFDEARGEVRLGAGISPGVRPATEHLAKPGRSRRAGRGHSGGDSFRRVQERSFA